MPLCCLCELCFRGVSESRAQVKTWSEARLQVSSQERELVVAHVELR